MVNDEKIIQIIIVLIVFGAFSSMVWFTMISPEMEQQNLCANKLNVKHDFWSGDGDVNNLHYEYMGNKRFNCCWDEVYLGDEGYYEKKKCKGFIKANST